MYREFLSPSRTTERSTRWHPSFTNAVGSVTTRSRVTLILAAFFLIGFVLPIPIMLGPLALSPYRLVALLALVPCSFIVVSGQAGGVRFADVLMIAHAVLAVVALLANHGFAQWQFAGMYVIETLGPYMLARCAIRSPADFRLLAQIVLVMILILLPFAILESLSGRNVMRTIFGGTAVITDMRMGLHRAHGPFEHPILYGNFVASCLGIVVYALGRFGARTIPLLLAAIVFAATFFSLSSGPVSTFAFQAFLILWGVTTARIPHNWWLLFGICAAAYITIDLLSNRTPFHVFVTYLTFNADSAYARFVIYESGFAEILRNPLFGIGMNEFVVPIYEFNSVDAFWLLQTMRYGVPAALCFIGAFLAMGFAVGRRTMPPEIARYRKGWMITIVGLALSGISVHYWGPVYCWYMFLLGSGAWMLSWQPAGQPQAAAGEADHQPLLEESRGRATFCRPQKTQWVRGDD